MYNLSWNWGVDFSSKSSNSTLSQFCECYNPGSLDMISAVKKENLLWPSRYLLTKTFSRHSRPKNRLKSLNRDWEIVETWKFDRYRHFFKFQKGDSIETKGEKLSFNFINRKVHLILKQKRYCLQYVTKQSRIFRSRQCT